MKKFLSIIFILICSLSFAQDDTYMRFGDSAYTYEPIYDARYLLRTCANDPLTNDLEITGNLYLDKGGHSYIYGGDTSGENLWLYANTADTKDFIGIFGATGVMVNFSDTNDFYIVGNNTTEYDFTQTQFDAKSNNITTTGTNTMGYGVINQTADNQGIQINGYDDQSGEYLKYYIQDDGASSILASDLLQLGANGNENTTFLSDSGTQITFYTSARDFKVRSANRVGAAAYDLYLEGGPAQVGDGGDVLISGGDSTLISGNGGDVTLAGGTGIDADGSVVITGTVDWTGITGNIDIGSNNFTTTGTGTFGSVSASTVTVHGITLNGSDDTITTVGTINLPLDTQGLIMGSDQDTTFYSNTSNAGTTNTYLYSDHNAHSLLLGGGTGHTKFRILADTVAGRGYFQTGIRDGADTGQIFFTGINIATLTNCNFQSALTRFSTNDITTPTEVFEIEGDLWIDGDNEYVKTGDGKDVGHYFDGSDWIFNSSNVTDNDEIHFTNFDAYLFDNKVIFTQTDGNEYIDSLADGYLDIGATTAIRNKNITIFENALYLTQTDGAEYIDSLADGYVDIGAGTAIRLNQDTNITGNLFLSTNYSAQFRDAQLYVNSDDDGHLDLHADTSIDLNGNVVATGTITGDGSTLTDVPRTSDHITIQPINYSGVTQGTWVWAADANQITCGNLYNSSNTDADQVDYLVGFEAGTWSFRAYCIKWGNAGIADLLIDGASQGTHDLYVAGATYNDIWTITGISITQGIHTISIKCNGKNAASGGHEIDISTMCFWRTS